MSTCELLQHLRSDYNIQEFCAAIIKDDPIISHPLAITKSFPIVFRDSHLLPKEVHIILHASHPGRELPQCFRFTSNESPFFTYFICQNMAHIRVITPSEYSKLYLAGYENSFFVTSFIYSCEMTSALNLVVPHFLGTPLEILSAVSYSNTYLTYLMLTSAHLAILHDVTSSNQCHLQKIGKLPTLLIVILTKLSAGFQKTRHHSRIQI